MAGVLGKALAGLGQGMAVVGQESLRDRAMMRREEALMKMRAEQEQGTYARNRADTLADQKMAGEAAAAAQLGKQEFEGGMAEYKASVEANVAARKHEYDKELKRIEAAGNLAVEKEKAKAKESGAGVGPSKFPGLKAGELMVQGSETPWKESDLQRAYERDYGKFDPLGKLMSIEEGAPKYTDWRNSVVEPEFRIGKKEQESIPRPWPTGGKLDSGTAKKLGVESSNIPTISTAAEHAKLPRGTQYKAPDGSVRVKQ